MRFLVKIFLGERVADGDRQGAEAQLIDDIES
jgi:hypothetical protein